MKKFIAMVMTAAMVASLVPATAFAKGDEAATARIVDAVDFTKEDAKAANGVIFNGSEGPELRLELTQVDNQKTSAGKLPTFTVELSMDGSEWTPAAKANLGALVTMHDGDGVDTYGKGTGTSMSGGVAETTTATYTVIGTENANKATNLDQAGINALKRAGATGLATDATGAGYKSWEDLQKMVGKTEKEKIAAYATWDVVKEAHNGCTYFEKAGFDAVLYKYADGTVHPDFASDKLTTLEAVVNSLGDSYDTAIKYEVKVTDPGKADDETIETATGKAAIANVYTVTVKDSDDDYAKFEIKYDPTVIEKGDYVSIDLMGQFDKLTVGTKATVSVGGVVDADDLVYATIEARGIDAATKKVGVVAEEEKNTLKKDIVITSKVGDFVEGQVIELKLSKGFEFVEKDLTTTAATPNYVWQNVDGNYAEIKITNGSVAGTKITDEIIIKADDCTIEATSAKAGATCVMTVKAVKATGIDGTFSDSATVEVMSVVDYTVIMSVDEDVDVPVIYSGVNVDNYGITDDSDHLSLEVTVEETFPGAWSFRKGFNLELPEGVYVTDVKINEVDGFIQTIAQNTADDAVDDEDAVDEAEMMAAFFNAYQDGNHVNFEFEKRVFDDVDTILTGTEAKVVFELELVADPGYVGDVTLKLTGELVDEQEVVIANFATPYIVTAEQNDLKIDYRYTEIPTTIVITETEAGLWAKDEAEFGFYMDKEDYIVFEDDPTFTINEESGLELKDAELYALDRDGDGDKDGDLIHALVDTESDEPAVVTISDLSLFMQRSIPAGPYDLKGWTSMAYRYEGQQLFAPDCMNVYVEGAECTCDDADNDCFVGEVCDYSDTVKEAFVNVVTAGREQDDASFTTKVVVPVGEAYLVAGETQVDLDVPAYINANGYTMLPVRAVATALGINNSNVLWDQATKTVTILYGQRIITMQVGASVVYVNGSAIPAASSVEIVDGRTFLGLRDLATALGVTDIQWDAATKTATLNGGQA